MSRSVHQLHPSARNRVSVAPVLRLSEAFLSASRCAAVAAARRSSYLTWKFFVGMRGNILWTIFSILSSTSSTARPVLLEGRNVLPITQHDIYVSAPGPRGTTVTVNFRFKPIGSCNDTLDSTLEYQLPPGYDETAIRALRRDAYDFDLKLHVGIRRNILQGMRTGVQRLPGPRRMRISGSALAADHAEVKAMFP